MTGVQTCALPICSELEQPSETEDQFSTKKAPFGRQPPYKRDLMGRSYLTLRILNPRRIFTLLAIKKKKKKVNNQYRLPFYNISEVVSIIQVTKVTNNLRDDQLK